MLQKSFWQLLEQKFSAKHKFLQSCRVCPLRTQTGVLLVEPTFWGLEGRPGFPYPSELAECTLQAKS